MIDKTHANRRIATGSRTSDGEDDGRIVVFPFVADQRDEAETDKLRRHLCRFLSPHDGRKVTEPLESRDCGKAIFVYNGCFAQDGLGPFLYVHELNTLGTLVVLMESVLGYGSVLRRVIWLTSDEPTEEGSYYGLCDDDLVICRAALEVK